MIKMNINTAVNIVIITAHDTCWANRDKSFLLRVSTLTRDIDIAIMSVCLSVHLSVCPSLSGVLSKRLYCAPVWSRSAHTSQVDVQLNSTMRLVSGTLRSTPLPWLPVLSNIEPPALRRKAATDKFVEKIVKRDSWPIQPDILNPPLLRLTSRKPLWLTCNQLTLKVDGGITGSRLR